MSKKVKNRVNALPADEPRVVVSARVTRVCADSIKASPRASAARVLETAFPPRKAKK